jgi:antitoxin (DNA-binding transcriptional repressor) of toxin-antitoxin stability system
LQRLVCVDVIDLGLMKSSYKGDAKEQHKVSIRWQSERCMADGKPFLVQKRYTLSMYENANLRKDLNMWRGVAFTDKQAAAFDLESLIGKCAYGNIIHVTRNGKTFADVVALAPLPAGVPKLAMQEYKRRDTPKPVSTGRDWVDQPPEGAEPWKEPEPVETPDLDDVPF